MLAGRLMALRRRTKLNKSVYRAAMAMAAPASMPSSSLRERTSSSNSPATVKASTPVQSDPSSTGTQTRETPAAG